MNNVKLNRSCCVKKSLFLAILLLFCFETIAQKQMSDIKYMDQRPRHRLFQRERAVRHPYWAMYDFPEWAIKTNLLGLAALAPNVEFEYYFKNDKSSVNAEIQLPWWKKDERHWYYQLLAVSPEYRHWLYQDGRYFGPFLGAHLQAGYYDFEFGGLGYQGETWGGGLTLGIMIPLYVPLRMEVSASAGYMFMQNREYVPIMGYYVIRRWLESDYWGITKAKISLVWRFNYK